MDGLRAKCEELGAHPRIWLRIPGYVIRNCSPDLEESVLHHMTTYFINEEPFCSSSKLSEDPLSLQEATQWWREILKQNLTLICLPEGSPGADLNPITEPRIRFAGVNVLMLGCKDDPPKPPLEEQFQGVNVLRALQPYADISKMVDCFSRFNVDAYMDAAGLSVHPEERGKGLGVAILKARLELCRGLGVKVTKTVFTSVASQTIALRCGYEPVEEILYGDIKDKQGQPNFPSIPAKNRVLVTVKTIDV